MRNQLQLSFTIAESKSCRKIHCRQVAESGLQGLLSNASMTIVVSNKEEHKRVISYDQNNSVEQKNMIKR